MTSYYTQSGWSGENYNRDLSLKEIANKVRAELKAKYGDCKFSVTTEYFSGGQALHVSLMSGPFVAAEGFVDRSKNYHNPEIIPFKGSAQLNDDMPDNDDLTSNGCKLTPECWEVMKGVSDMIKSYRYSDCDSMIDYFHVNFWFHLNIGKWDKPYKQTEPAKKAPTEKKTAQVVVNNGAKIGEYKGHPIITLTLENGKEFSFGLSKAKAIVSHIKSIEQFAN